MQQASSLWQPSSVTVVYPLNCNLSSLALWMVFMLTSSKRDAFLWLWGGPLHLRLAQPDHRVPPCLLSHGTPGSWRLDGASSGPPCQDLPLWSIKDGFRHIVIELNDFYRILIVLLVFSKQFPYHNSASGDSSPCLVMAFPIMVPLP